MINQHYTSGKVKSSSWEMGAHLGSFRKVLPRAGALNELTAACLLVACSTCFESARS